MGSKLLQGDCLEVLKSIPDNSLDSIVTDPPYGLSFMGKRWDYDVPSVDVWAECLRVLKPGGHLLAFAGTRTQHRMAVRIEDAGFEIRDMIAWVYGSGYPKHRSSLKPALEPITMARKPAKVATLLNIDACRVGDAVRYNPPVGELTGYGSTRTAPKGDGQEVMGRYPANLIHDGSDEVVAMFPDKYLGGERTKVDCGTGSAARFFYCAKASKKDRDEGLEGFEKRMAASACARVSQLQGEEATCISNTKNPRANVHPTVKPTDLMRYLCRLVTPTGGVVLDPFMGSGSTGKAATIEGFDFIGIEMDENYFNIAKARIEDAEEKLGLFA